MAQTAVEHAVAHAVSSGALEGWAPTPEFVDLLTDRAAGVVGRHEFLERVSSDVGSLQSARRRRWPLSRAMYTVPGTSTLVNKFRIENPAHAQSLEFALAAERSCELILTGGAISADASGLLEVHRQLFQDMYTWAGHVRTVQLSKNGTAFAPLARIGDYLNLATDTITEFDWERGDHGSVAYRCAAVYAHLNHAHPFRDGNGRSGRLFLHGLVDRTAFAVDYSGVDRTDWIRASIDSAPHRADGIPSARPFLPIFLRALSERE